METIGTCAVVGCTNRGRPQVCVFDGRYHHHGHTHYNNFGPRVGLVFRSITDGWFDMCNDHQAIIAAAMSHAPKATV